MSRARTSFRDLSFALEIALVSYDNHGEIVLILHSQNLLLKRGDFLEALARRDRVDQKKPLSRAHVLLPHSRVFLLAGSIEHIEQGDLIVNHALLSVRVCDNWP